VAREARNVAERDFQSKRMEKLNAQRHKLLDAYYAGAVDVVMLREEQNRLRREIADVESRLRDVDATLAQWQDILDIAGRFARSCSAAYRVANERTRTLYNRAVFDTLIVRDGRIAEPRYAEPFGLVFGVDEFEQGSLERETRLELATLTLARYASNSVFGKGRKCPLNDYLPPISTGVHADHTGRHSDHTALHADHKTPQPAEMVVDARWTVTGSTRYSPTAAGDTIAPSSIALPATKREPAANELVTESRAQPGGPGASFGRSRACWSVSGRRAKCQAGRRVSPG
jgi:hypothetical protein